MSDDQCSDAADDVLDGAWSLPPPKAPSVEPGPADPGRRNVLSAVVAATAAVVTGAGVVAESAKRRRWSTPPQLAGKGDGSTVLAQPLGGGQDDAPALQALCEQYAGKKKIQLAPGLWTLKSTVTLPARTTLLGGPDVRIVVALTTEGALQTGPVKGNCAFYASGTAVQVGTSLHTAAVVGQNEVLLDAPMPVGGWLAIGSAAHRFQMGSYRVLAVSGTGPFKHTLDRPILYAIEAGSPANHAAKMPECIRVHGGGMSMSGECVRYFEIVAGIDCLIEDVVFDRLDGSPSDMCAAYDAGGVRNLFRKLKCDGGGNLTACCLALESNDGSKIEECEVSYAGPAYGIALIDCVNSEVVDCNAHHNAFGLVIGGDANILGSRHCRVRGGTFSGNGTGVYIGWGSSHNELVSFQANDNSAIGIHIDGAGAMDQNRLAKFEATGNYLYGVYIAPNPTMRTFAEDATLSANGHHALFAQSTTYVEGLTILDGAPRDRVVQDIPTGTLSLKKVSITSTAKGPIALIRLNNGVLYLDNAELKLSSGSTGVALSPTTHGAAYLTRTRVAPVDLKSGEAGIRQAGGTLCLGCDVNVSECTTPVQSTGGVQLDTCDKT